MESIGWKSTPLVWKLSILLPLASDVALQLLAHERTRMHSSVALSSVGNLFLSASLIAQSLFMMRKSSKWGIALLILSIMVAGFGLYVSFRAMSS